MRTMSTAVGRQGSQDFPAPGVEAVIVGLLGRLGPVHGPVHLEGRHAQFFAQLPQAFAQPALAPAEIEHRGQHFGAVVGKIDGGGHGVGQGLGHGTDHPAADLGMGMGQVDEAGQEDALDPGL